MRRCVNNLIFDPGSAGDPLQSDGPRMGRHPHQPGELSAVGNVLRAGFSTRADIAFLTIGGVGDLRYLRPRQYRGRPPGRPLPMFGRYTTSPARIVPVARPRSSGRRASPSSAGQPGRDPCAAQCRRAPLGPRSARHQHHLRRRRGPRPHHRRREARSAATPQNERPRARSSRPTGISTRWSRGPAIIPGRMPR